MAIIITKNGMMAHTRFSRDQKKESPLTFSLHFTQMDAFSGKGWPQYLQNL
jgi:hypothetical protein